MTVKTKFSFLEFFAGGGMARAGLGNGWDCTFANDFDGKKGLTYQNNWGTQGELLIGDIRRVEPQAIDVEADLAWGSFPCQDLSLAGGGAGLRGERSGTFYPFWDVMKGLIFEGRAPKIIALENVCGTLTSHGGADFNAICKTFSAAGYNYGAVVINACHFVPHSRPRLFVVGVRKDIPIATHFVIPEPVLPFHTKSLQRAFDRVEGTAKNDFVWWNLPTPPKLQTKFSDVVENFPSGVEWNSDEQTEKLLAIMSPKNLAKVQLARSKGKQIVGGVYKRTRIESGDRIVRAEVRFDDIAGCLRTPNGGSSRQTILIVDGHKIRSRLLTTRETARLMGLDDSYKLPKNYNEAYHLTGDGVVVPVVRFLAEHLFEPILSHRKIAKTPKSAATKRKAA
jgi:DNA (cytosine-5)-methyltransferase 1